ncbi:MAG TPA: response regulator, partial [Sphingobacteriaceae bacterium]
MRRILLIEDDLELRENIAEILTLSNYRVVQAGDGKTGVEKALKEKPDLIICDIMMPGLDGYGVIHILGRHPDTFAIPFIYLTGKREPDDLRKGMALGADDYLIKPFNETDLLNTIDIRIRKSEALKHYAVPAPVSMETLMRPVSEPGGFHLVSGEREIHTYSRKHVLYAQGQRPATVYFVVRGKVKEFLINEEGKELITNMYTDGDFIGYTALLNDTSYTETAQVIEEAELMLIPRNDFLQLINNDRQVARQFISLLAGNIREKEERLLNLAYNSLRKKVASGIIGVIDQFKNKKEGKP